MDISDNVSSPSSHDSLEKESFVQKQLFTQKSFAILDSAAFAENSKGGIKCTVCGKSFSNRSKKFYHKSKFATGTGCNVPDTKGRPLLK